MQLLGNYDNEDALIELRLFDFSSTRNANILYFSSSILNIVNLALFTPGVFWSIDSMYKDLLLTLGLGLCISTVVYDFLRSTRMKDQLQYAFRNFQNFKEISTPIVNRMYSSTRFCGTLLALSNAHVIYLYFANSSFILDDYGAFATSCVFSINALPLFGYIYNLVTYNNQRLGEIDLIASESARTYLTHSRTISEEEAYAIVPRDSSTAEVFNSLFNSQRNRNQ